jgi:hypothetical protein
MFSELKKGIEEANQRELEAISLRETLSLEEAICDMADEKFVTEATALAVGKDLPDSVKAGDFTTDAESYMFHNQDRLPGLDQEDLEDIATHPHGAAPSHVSESVSLLDYLLEGKGSDCDGDGEEDKKDDKVSEASDTELESDAELDEADFDADSNTEGGDEHLADQEMDAESGEDDEFEEDLVEQLLGGKAKAR